MASSDSLEKEPSTQDLGKKLAKVARDGPESEFRELLMEWKRRALDKKIIDHCTLCAVGGNQASFVRQLLEHGAEPPRPTASHGIRSDVSIEVWQALVDHGWDLSSQTIDGADPIIL